MRVRWTDTLDTSKSAHTQATATISQWILLSGHLQITFDIHYKMYPDFRNEEYVSQDSGNVVWNMSTNTHTEKRQKGNAPKCLQVVYTSAYLHSLNIWSKLVLLLHCKNITDSFFFLKNWALYFKGCCSPLEYKKLE